jgi:8-oxo-dGTP pyrophosphatase MutT (NUDIX family)
MERYQTIRAYSAGGVVFRIATLLTHEKESVEARFIASVGAETSKRTSVEVALVGWSQQGLWTLPKGTPCSGETIEQVAAREVREETGLEVHLIAYIGAISYSFIRDQVRYYKQVRHFLFEAVGGDITLHDHEYDRVAWFPLPEACRRVSYANEANILSQAEDIVQRWLKRQQNEG